MILSIKINSLHDAIEISDASNIEVATASAQNSPSNDEKADTASSNAAQPNEKGDLPSDKEEQDAQSKKEVKDVKSKEKLKVVVDGSDPSTIMVNEDPTLLTPSEIELLQQLSQRRKDLDGREQELEMRTGLLTAAETRIDKKIKELKNLRITIVSNIKTHEEQQDAKLLSLVKIYENMKPKDAARIFENLELETLLEVVEQMKERKLAPIMAKMNAEKAREVTVELRQLRRLPPTGG